jgi:hypothetical protein
VLLAYVEIGKNGFITLFQINDDADIPENMVSSHLQSKEFVIIGQEIKGKKEEI